MFTSKLTGVPGTYLIELGTMKDWIDLGGYTEDKTSFSKALSPVK